MAGRWGSEWKDAKTAFKDAAKTDKPDGNSKFLGIISTHTSNIAAALKKLDAVSAKLATADASLKAATTEAARNKAYSAHRTIVPAFEKVLSAYIGAANKYGPSITAALNSDNSDKGKPKSAYHRSLKMLMKQLASIEAEAKLILDESQTKAYLAYEVAAGQKSPEKAEKSLVSATAIKRSYALIAKSRTFAAKAKALAGGDYSDSEEGRVKAAIVYEKLKAETIAPLTAALDQVFKHYPKYMPFEWKSFKDPAGGLWRVKPDSPDFLKVLTYFNKVLKQVEANIKDLFSV